MSIVEIINGETQISIAPEADASTVVVMSSDDLTVAIETGEQGPPGIQGPPGVDGPPSTVPGPAGNTILYGTVDPSGSVGRDGDSYINETTHFIFGPKVSGAWPAGVSLVGPSGNTILYGTTDPVAATGVNGDSYINSTTHFIFGPKAGGAWPAGTSLIGPTGPIGPPGLPGADGAGAPGTAPPIMDSTATVGTSMLFSRQDHIHPSDTSRVNKAGDTMTGDLKISKVTPDVTLDRTASGQDCGLYGTVAGKTRWAISLGNANAEIGGNAGSDFGIARFADDGTYIDGPITIARSSGAIGLAADASMTKANPTLLLNKTAAAQTNGIYGMTNSSYRWGISLGDANAESGSNNGSFFSITAFNDAGGSIFTPISIARYDGLVFLAGDPTQPLHAATKQYVDGHASSTPFAAMAYNGIQLNGGMEVNQFRAAGVGVALANSTAFVLDCWRCASSGVATISAAQNTGAFPGGFQNCLQMVPTVGTSSPGTGDYNIAYQRIEGLAVRNLQWGSASASPVTLSFWVAAGRPGLNSGLITNGITNSRSYAFTYTINVANTWEYKTITIPGDTTGTWVKDNTGGFQVSFCMMGGGTALIAPNVWGSTTGVVGAIGQTNNCQTGGDQMLITGVTLFAGSVGPSAQQSVFVARPYHLESARCKRYYQQLGGVLFAGYQGGSGAFYGDFSFLEMRASPSVSAANMAYSNASTVALNVAYPYHMRLQAVMTATGYGFAYGDYSLDATI